MPDPVFAKGLNNPRYQEEVFARTKTMIDLCAEHGVPNVIAFTGYKWRDADRPRRAARFARDEGAANTVRGPARAGAHTPSREGVTVCLEHLNTRDDSHPMKGHPGYQGDDIDYCAEIIRAAGSPHAKLLFDVYHVSIMNGDVIRRLRQYRDMLGPYPCGGHPGRANWTNAQEIYFPAVMRTLVEIGYQGYVGQEFIPTRDPEVGLKEAVGVCDV